MKKNVIPKIFSIVLIFTACLTCIFFACQNKKPLTFQGFYFNTVITFTFYTQQDSSLQDECFALCQYYESLLSRTVEGSDIWKINHAGGNWVCVEEETYALLQQAHYYCEQTDGKIDYTVAPLMDLWNFTGTESDKRPPENALIQETLSHVNYKNLIFQDGKVRLTDPSSSLDLGFIAKGYIGDRIRDYLRSQGVTSAIINLGGNVLTIGNKPDNTAYNIGIRNPFTTGDTIDTIAVTNRCVTTSGTYERSFEYQNITYHHILDPVSGMPINNGLVSVTIVSDDAATGDALSTTCLLLGKEKGLEFVKSFENTDAIFIEENGEITSTLD